MIKDYRKRQGGEKRLFMEDLIQKIRTFQKTRPCVFTQKNTPSAINAQLESNGYFTILPPKNRPLVDICLHWPPIFDPDGYYYHRHNFFELAYVYRGCCVNLMPESRLHLKQGDLILFNPNITHAVGTLSENDCVINIIIQKDIFKQTILSMQKSNDLISGFLINYICDSQKMMDYIYFPSSPAYSVDPYIDNLLSELTIQRPYYESMVQSSLISLITVLMCMYDSTHHHPGEQLMSNLITYINNNLNTVSLEELSEKFHYSESYISRKIQEYTGKSFSKILQESKLEQIKRYLETSSISIENIAHLIGYNDASYLHQVFKKQYGVSPAAYRKSVQSNSRPQSYRGKF